jgi:voltage-gated sodium channel
MYAIETSLKQATNMTRPSNLIDEQFQGLRRKVVNFIESKTFICFITFVIILNAITLGLETNNSIIAQHSELFTLFDKIVVLIFVIEMALKLYVYRLSFFRAGWNVFDFLIISIAFIPAMGPISVIRALRILRVLRLISIVPQMRRVIGALIHAIPGMASILAVLLIIFYVAAVLVTTLFGGEFELLFGSIGASMYTLFQIMTLEGWSEEVVRPVMTVYPLSWMFFIPFITITSFAVLNLFIGIIVDAMNIMHDKDDPYTGPERRKQHEDLDDIKALRMEIAELKQLIIKDKS